MSAQIVSALVTLKSNTNQIFNNSFNNELTGSQSLAVQTILENEENLTNIEYVQQLAYQTGLTDETILQLTQNLLALIKDKKLLAQFDSDISSKEAEMDKTQQQSQEKLQKLNHLKTLQSSEDYQKYQTLIKEHQSLTEKLSNFPSHDEELINTAILAFLEEDESLMELNIHHSNLMEKLQLIQKIKAILVHYHQVKINEEQQLVTAKEIQVQCELLERYGLDSSAGIEQIEQTYKNSNEQLKTAIHNLYTTLTELYPSNIQEFLPLMVCYGNLQDGDLDDKSLNEINHLIDKLSSNFSDSDPKLPQALKSAQEAIESIKHFGQYRDIAVSPKKADQIQRNILSEFSQVYSELSLDAPEVTKIKEVMPALKQLSQSQQQKVNSNIQIIQNLLEQYETLNEKQTIYMAYAHITEKAVEQDKQRQRAQELQKTTKIYIQRGNYSSLDALLDALLLKFKGDEHISFCGKIAEYRSKLGTNEFKVSDLSDLEKIEQQQRQQVASTEVQLEYDKSRLDYLTEVANNYAKEQALLIAKQLKPKSYKKYDHPSPDFITIIKSPKKAFLKNDYRRLNTWLNSKSRRNGQSWDMNGKWEELVRSNLRLQKSEIADQQYRKYLIKQQLLQHKEAINNLEKKNGDFTKGPITLQELVTQVEQSTKEYSEIQKIVAEQKRTHSQILEARDDAIQQIMLLCEKKFSIDSINPTIKLTQLIDAAKKNDIELFKLKFTNYEFNLSTRDNVKGNSLLHVLAQMAESRQAFIEDILSNVSIESLHDLLSIKNTQGKTPLQVCSEANKTLLLRKYFDVLRETLKTDVNKAVKFYSEASPLNLTQDFITNIIKHLNSEEIILQETTELLQFINKTNVIELLNTSFCQNLDTTTQLFEALEAMDVEIQRQFITALVDPEFTAEKYQQPFIAAINALINTNPKLAIQLNKLLSTEKTLAALDENENTLLHLALALDGKDSDLVQLLFSENIAVVHYGQQNSKDVKPYQLLIKDLKLIKLFLYKYGDEAFVEKFDGQSLYKHTEEPIKSVVKKMCFDKCLQFIENGEAEKARNLIAVNGLDFNELPPLVNKHMMDLTMQYRIVNRNKVNTAKYNFYTFDYNGQSIYSKSDEELKKALKTDILDLAISNLTNNNVEQGEKLLKINEFSIKELTQRKDNKGLAGQHLEQSIEKLQRTNPGKMLTVNQARNLVAQCINNGGKKNDAAWKLVNTRKYNAFSIFINGEKNQALESLEKSKDNHVIIEKANAIFGGKNDYDLLAPEEQARLYQLLNFAYDIEDEIANGQENTFVQEYIANLDKYLPYKPSSFLLYHEMMDEEQVNPIPWSADKIGSILEQSVSESSDDEKKEYINRCKDLFTKGQKLKNQDYNEDGRKLQDSVIRIALFAKHGETNKIPNLSEDKRYGAINHFRTSWYNLIKHFVNLFKKTTKSQKRLNNLCATPQKSNGFFKPEKSCDMTYVGNTLPDNCSPYNNSYILTNDSLYFIGNDSTQYKIALNNHGEFVQELLTMVNLTISDNSEDLNEYKDKKITLPQSKLNQLLLNQGQVDKFHHNEQINKQEIMLHRQIPISA